MKEAEEYIKQYVQNVKYIYLNSGGGKDELIYLDNESRVNLVDLLKAYANEVVVEELQKAWNSKDADNYLIGRVKELRDV